jgi:hypothetical protein
MEEAFTAPAALRAKLAFVAVAVLRVDSSRFGRKKIGRNTHESFGLRPNFVEFDVVKALSTWI